MGVALDFPIQDLPALWAPRSRRESRRERRALVRRDRQSARLSELVTIRDVLGRAADLIDRGWLQDAWFSYRDAAGDVRVSYVLDRRRAADQPVLSTCLVAAIRDAGGPEGPAARVVPRALELTWHTLHVGPGEPVRWCPPPDVRAVHVRDLTRWNDSSRRTSAEVTTLLDAARSVAETERERVMANDPQHRSTTSP
jgi:hypothetical protein